jgi:GNAT acetyltransferase-like protein
MGESLKVRVATKDGEAIAAIITLSFKGSMTYKYGCSDARYHSLGGMPFLYWKAIHEATSNSATEFDLGRSDFDTPALITFKDHWAASRFTLTHWRYLAQKSEATHNDWKLGLAKSAFAYQPDRLLMTTGKFLYRHIG